MPRPSALSIEELLRHRAWLQRLARALANDPGEADDAVQDTWVAALRGAPSDVAFGRAWLRRVFVRELGRRRRRDVARRRREVRSEARPTVPPTDELVARLEVQQRVTRIVHGLPEPYRTVVLLRFFEGLAPREVAACTDVPVETVRTRTRRALARIREQLDAAGDSLGWRAALLPLATGAARLEGPLVPDRGGVRAWDAAGATGGLLMGTVGKTAAAAAVIALVLAALWTAAPGADSSVTPATSAPLGDVVTPRTARVAPAVHDAESQTGGIDVVDPQQPVARVVVRDLSGAPLRGVVIEAFPQHELRYGPDWIRFIASLADVPTPVARARTDERGVARLNTGSGRRWTLRARAPGLAVTGAVRPNGAPGSALELTMRPGHVLAGVVRDHLGRPLEDADVVALVGGFTWNRDAAPLRVVARTGSDGRYRLPGLLPGLVQLVARAPDGPVVVQGTVVVPAVTSFDCEVGTGAALSGRLTDVESGEPIAGAEIRLGGPGAVGWWVPITATTDSDGRYRVEGLPDFTLRTRETRVTNGDWVFVEEPDGTETSLAVTSGSETRWNPRARRGGALDGVVTGDGAPVEDAFVELSFGYASTMVDWLARTDASGRYRFDGLPETDAIVVVHADGWFQSGLPRNARSHEERKNLPDEVRVDVPRSGVVHHRTRLTRGRVVSGRVTSAADSSEVADASVRVRAGGTERRVRTADDGTFTADGLDPSVPAILEVGGRGWATERVEAAPDSDGTVTVVLRRAATVRGRVVVAGAPPRPGSFVQVWPAADAAGSSASQRHAVAADGTFTAYAPAASGTFVLRAETLGGAAADSEPIELPLAGPAAEDGAGLLEIRIVEGSEWLLRITDADSGEPLQGALVLRTRAEKELRSRRWADAIWARSDARGEAALHDLPPGRHRVVVRLEGWTESAFDIDAVAARSVRRDVRLERERFVAGRVVRADGTPAAHARVAVAAKVGTDQTVVTGRAAVSGSFRVTGVGRGRLQIRAWSPTLDNAPPVVVDDVRVGSSDVELRLAPERPLAGRVVDRRGRPVARVPLVVAESGDGGRQVARTVSDQHGRFELRGAPLCGLEIRVTENEEGIVGEPTSVPAHGGKGVRVVVGTGLTLRGRLMLWGTDPVEGAGVVVRREDPRVSRDTGERWGEVVSVTTAADGSFEARGLVAGTYGVEVPWLPGDLLENYALSGHVGIAAGGPVATIVVDGGLSIEGHLLDEHGRVLQVSGGDWSAIATPEGGGRTRQGPIENGAFRVTGLQPGERYRISHQLDGVVRVSSEPSAAGARGVTVTIPTAGRTSATLRTEGGEPVAGRMYMVRADDGTTLAAGTTTEDGSFEIHGLPAGTHVVEVAVPGRIGEARFWTYKRAGTVVAGSAGTSVTVPPAK